MRIRVLDIDGSLPTQTVLGAALAERRAQRVDLRTEERTLRLWATRSRMSRLVARLAADPPSGSGPVVTFYGSGDYHHLATALIAATADPVTVLHFDNHPDWVRVPATHNCGGWINRALALPQVQRIVTLGVCSDDLVYPQLKTGNVAALSTGRLELFPWRALPTRVWGRIGDGPGHRQVGARLVWTCMADQPWPAFLDALVARLPTHAVWISIDKDVLRPADATTNWDQGEMPLEALLTAIERVARSRTIVGVDICGEYSPPRFDNPIKRAAAWLDHPRVARASPDMLMRNDQTNRDLIAALSGVLQ